MVAAVKVVLVEVAHLLPLQVLLILVQAAAAVLQHRKFLLVILAQVVRV
jgi:hypothetical protein